MPDVDVHTGSATGPASASGPDGPGCASAALGELVGGRDQPLAPVRPRPSTQPTPPRCAPRSTTWPGGTRPESPWPPTLTPLHPGGRPDPPSRGGRPPTREHRSGGWQRAGRGVRLVRGGRTTGHCGQPTGLRRYLQLRARAGALVVERAVGEFGAQFAATAALRSPVAGFAALRGRAGEHLRRGNADPAGFAEYLAVQGQHLAGPPLIYSAARVDAMPMDRPDMSAPYPGQWVPNGTIVPISGKLQDG
jgi:hypothetical protein